MKRSRRRAQLRVSVHGRGVVSMLVPGCWRIWPGGPGGAELSAALGADREGPPPARPDRDVLVDLAVMLADGGESVSDLKVLRDAWVTQLT